MKIQNYIVKFFKKKDQGDEKDTFLGSVEVDDSGVDNGLTIMAKAFRQAPPSCLLANKVRAEKR